MNLISFVRSKFLLERIAVRCRFECAMLVT
jgi:hypothetical protein